MGEDLSIEDIFNEIYGEKPQVQQRISNKCKNCRIPFSEIDHQWVCLRCGQVNEECRSYSNTYEQSLSVIPKYEYQRITHFRDRLMQAQGNQNTILPKHIIELLERELAKHHVDPKDVTPEIIGYILKKLKARKFYEHESLIVSYFTGKTTLKLTQDEEKELITKFLAIQEPFQRCKPKDRKSFLSYKYVIHKLLELMDKEDLASHFPYLKSTDKLCKLDHIWKKICEEVGFVFIPSL